MRPDFSVHASHNANDRHRLTGGRRSSVAEHRPCNSGVLGSIPGAGSKNPRAISDNGSTSVLQTEGRGSIPRWSTNYSPVAHRQSGRLTSSVRVGSIPTGTTNLRRSRGAVVLTLLITRGSVVRIHPALPSSILVPSVGFEPTLNGA